MSRQDANAAFARTSFLYGGNAAYIEDLYAKYEKDPAAVDADWREFFQSLKDEAADVVKSARGASWQKPNWPIRANGDLVGRARRQLAGNRKGDRRQDQEPRRKPKASRFRRPRCSRRRAIPSTR